MLNQPEKSVPPRIYFGKQCSFGGEGEIGGGKSGAKSGKTNKELESWSNCDPN